MDALEIGLLSWVVFLVGVLILYWVCPPDPVQAFREQCRRQGLDFKETEAALAIRIAFVRVRRKASDLCLELDGDISDAHISDLIDAEARILNLLHGPKAAKSFIAWIQSCPENEILYRDAMDVRMQYFNRKIREFPKLEPDPQALADLRAACTILK